MSFTLLSISSLLIISMLCSALCGRVRTSFNMAIYIHCIVCLLYLQQQKEIVSFSKFWLSAPCDRGREFLFHLHHGPVILERLKCSNVNKRRWTFANYNMLHEKCENGFFLYTHWGVRIFQLNSHLCKTYPIHNRVITSKVELFFNITAKESFLCLRSKSV